MHDSDETHKKVSNSRASRGLLRHSVGTTDPRTRIRQRIRRLLEDRAKTNRALGQWLGHGDQWVSNLLAGRFALSLDELDRVATFLRVPPSEIVRESDDPWELTPSEMRMIRALRMLPEAVRDHLVTLADYLIGTTPDEVELLKTIRELSVENRQTVGRWTDALYRAQVRELDAGGLDVLLREVEPPSAPTQRSQRDQKPGKAGKK